MSLTCQAREMKWTTKNTDKSPPANWSRFQVAFVNSAEESFSVGSLFFLLQPILAKGLYNYSIGHRSLFNWFVYIVVACWADFLIKGRKMVSKIIGKKRENSDLLCRSFCSVCRQATEIRKLE